MDKLRYLVQIQFKKEYEFLVKTWDICEPVKIT